MQNADTLIRTKLRLPFTRPELVPRPRLHARLAQGLRGPLTLVTAPAGFGKTTLVASYIQSIGLPVAWLSLDRDDNQVELFLNYLVAALQETHNRLGKQAAQLLRSSQPPPPESILTSLVNDLDGLGQEIVLVLDDYQFIRSQAVHQGVAFLLEHCPISFHLLISTRSDPPLPLTRLRARGQMVELRLADLRFTQLEAAQFLNEVMGLQLDAASVRALEERTEGWIAGLQMAALSMRERHDVAAFIEGFSGTNRYILDYLLEEVLAGQPAEIQRFLLWTSILERLSAPLCDAVLQDQNGSESPGGDPSSFTSLSAAILEYLEGANLFLVPLDDERTWYRYHHLFADLLRTQLHRSLEADGVARLHLRAAGWHAENGSILEAIQHASIAPDHEMVEQLIEEHYMEMVNRGEMSWVRYWMGELSTDLIYRRPWLCLYQALSRSWFGQLEDANLLLNEAQKRIPAQPADPGAQAMLGYHAFVKSRVIAMQGDTRRAIEFCLRARHTIPADNLALQNEVSITLGYEYFLYGDFANAGKILQETIQSGSLARAVNNPVAAYALLARAQAYQGRLHAAQDLLQSAAQLIEEVGGPHLGASGLVELGVAALSCEWNDLEAALLHVKRSLDFLPSWGKADDLCLAYTSLRRIQHARGEPAEAAEAVEKATRLIQTGGVFSEARGEVESAQAMIWLAAGDWPSVDRWLAALEERLSTHDRFGFENELLHLTQARVWIARNKADKAIGLLSRLEGAARLTGRLGRLIEITLLEALARQETGDLEHALLRLSECLELAESEGYVRLFLDEGQRMQRLLDRWLAQASAGHLRDYAAHLLSHFAAGAQLAQAAHPPAIPAGPPPARPAQVLVEPLSQRELEVLEHIALGQTNQEIAAQLIIAPGTVKAHTASIYRKLDVSNRTEAVARARQLDLLS